MNINVIDDKGFEKNAYVITAFRLLKKKYVIYTFGDEEVSNSCRVYISELRIKSKHFSFNNIISGDDWQLVKDLMKEMAKGSSCIDTIFNDYDFDVVNMDDVCAENEYVLATIKDSKVVKVSTKFIKGLNGTYVELCKKLKKDDVKKEKKEIVVEQKVSKEKVDLSSNDTEVDSHVQKMKDIWEYSSLLQKKIAKDMESLNSKIVKLDGEKYYVNVKDPLYLKEKLNLQENIIESSSMTDEALLKELEPSSVEIKIDSSNLFNQLEKELAGINDNFNKIVAKNQEKKEKIASEIEKRLNNVAAKEQELLELEKKLNEKEKELKRKEEDLMIANSRLEENIKELTRYANMFNSVVLKRSVEE